MPSDNTIAVVEKQLAQQSYLTKGGSGGILPDRGRLKSPLAPL